LPFDFSQGGVERRRLREFDRAKARECFERRFTIERVADDYMNIYRNLPGLRSESPARARRRILAKSGTLFVPRHFVHRGGTCR
jgi:hypothetical protein